MNRRAMLFGIAALAIAACTTSDGPTDPVWGKEPCAHCRMLVSDARYAAQVVAGGDRKYFDDVGCMVRWLEDRKAAGKSGADRNGDRAWVRDATANRWLEAERARYVRGAKTPMDFGFEACAEGGIGWDEMRDEVVARKGER